MCPDSMPWLQFPLQFPWSNWAGSRVFGRGDTLSHLFCIAYFARRIANLTSAWPIRSNRAHAQVAELVDALASGASGFTAVKVRVLSWAPPNVLPCSPPFVLCYQ